MHPARIVALLLATLPATATATATFAPVRDLAADGAVATARELPVILVFSADYCGYCSRVKEEFLEPMAANRDYRDRVLMREVAVDRHRGILDFDGAPVNPGHLAARYRVRVTPTLVFVDGAGRELAPPLVGPTTVDFYGLYLDAAIDRARNRLQGELP